MFKKKKQTPFQPTKRGLYAWNAMHAGSFLLYVNSFKDHHQFLFLPGPSEYCLTNEDFSFCIKSNTLEFVEALPQDIFDESVKLSLSCPPINSNIIGNESTQNQIIGTVPKENSNA